MATTTTKLGLRKPDGDPTTGDNINVDLDLNDNFDKLDDAIGVKVCTSSTRPSGSDRWDGRIIRETDTGKSWLWAANLGSWVPLLAGETFDGNINIPTNTRQINIGGSASSASLAVQNDGARALLSGRQAGDSQNRFQIDIAGGLAWGSGSASADTTLYRSASNTLKTDDSLIVQQALTVNGNFTWANCTPVESENNTVGNTTSTSYTATLSGATTPGVSFVAPPSGRVWVNWFSQQLNATATSSVFSTFEVRTGSSIGSGTIVVAASDSNAHWSDPAEAENNISTCCVRKLIAGLTPGASYNARGMYKSATGGTGEYRGKSISVEPSL